MKKTLIAVLLMCFVVSGCTGTFALTKKVYNFHRSQTDKWGDELLFLVCVLVPVYGISTFADAIVFNSIEFWTGDNPVKSTAKVQEGNKVADLSFNPQTKQVTIAKDGSAVTLEKVGSMMVAKDQSGKILYGSTTNAKGEMVIYDQNLQLVKTYSSVETDQLKEKYLK